MQNDDLLEFLAIYEPPLDKDYFDKFESYFKLALQASPLIVKEKIDRASKYPDQNMALKSARKQTKKMNEFSSFFPLEKDEEAEKRRKSN